MIKSERLDVKVFKPRIDAALAALAPLVGADRAEVERRLASLSTTSGPFTYLEEALDATRDVLATQRVHELGKKDWFLYFLAGESKKYEGHFLAGKRADQFMEAVEIELDSYPEESHQALKQGQFRGGHDSDVLVLFRQPDGRNAVCLAHPEGFWVLAEDAIDFVERFAKKCAGETLPEVVLPAPKAKPKPKPNDSAGGDNPAALLAKIKKAKDYKRYDVAIKALGDTPESPRRLMQLVVSRTLDAGADQALTNALYGLAFRAAHEMRDAADPEEVAALVAVAPDAMLADSYYLRLPCAFAIHRAVVRAPAPFLALLERLSSPWRCAVTLSLVVAGQSVSPPADFLPWLADELGSSRDMPDTHGGFGTYAFDHQGTKDWAPEFDALVSKLTTPAKFHELRAEAAVRRRIAWAPVYLRELVGAPLRLAVRLTEVLQSGDDGIVLAALRQRGEPAAELYDAARAATNERSRALWGLVATIRAGEDGHPIPDDIAALLSEFRYLWQDNTRAVIVTALRVLSEPQRTALIAERGLWCQDEIHAALSG